MNFHATGMLLHPEEICNGEAMVKRQNGGGQEVTGGRRRISYITSFYLMQS